jgi:hypothetical protein
MAQKTASQSSTSTGSTASALAQAAQASTLRLAGFVPAGELTMDKFFKH